MPHEQKIRPHTYFRRLNKNQSIYNSKLKKCKHKRNKGCFNNELTERKKEKQNTALRNHHHKMYERSTNKQKLANFDNKTII